MHGSFDDIIGGVDYIKIAMAGCTPRIQSNRQLYQVLSEISSHCASGLLIGMRDIGDSFG